MKTVLTTNDARKLFALTSLLAAMACSGEDPSSGSSQNPVKGANGQCDESDDGPDDKIHCSTDADCDSDEVCMNDLCTGLDGETEDDETEDGDDDDGDDDDDCEDDEDGDDKITCAVDGDCDADEVCTDGLCTGLPEACATDADCDSDEACTNGLCEDR
jgi:hypothetical protein